MTLHYETIRKKKKTKGKKRKKIRGETSEKNSFRKEGRARSRYSRHKGIS